MSYVTSILICRRRTTQCTSLGAVEVSRDGDGVGGDTTEVRLGSLPHLGQDHQRYSLGGLKSSQKHNRDRLGNDQTHEFLILATILNPGVRLASLVNGLEGECLMSYCALASESLRSTRGMASNTLERTISVLIDRYNEVN